MLQGTCSRPLVTGQSILKRFSPGGSWALLGISIIELVYLLGCYWVPLRAGTSSLCISQFQILWVLNSYFQFLAISNLLGKLENPGLHLPYFSILMGLGGVVVNKNRNFNKVFFLIHFQQCRELSHHF